MGKSIYQNQNNNDEDSIEQSNKKTIKMRIVWFISLFLTDKALRMRGGKKRRLIIIKNIKYKNSTKQTNEERTSYSFFCRRIFCFRLASSINKCNVNIMVE